MPYDIRKFPQGYKVCKKGTKKCFSNDPIPLKNAIAQRKAIGISGGKATLEGCGFFDDEDWEKVMTGGDFDWWGIAKDIGSDLYKQGTDYISKLRETEEARIKKEKTGFGISANSGFYRTNPDRLKGSGFFDDEDWEKVMAGGMCPRTGKQPCMCGGDIDWSALGNIAYDIVKTQQKDQGYKPNKRKEGDDERNWGYDEEEEVAPPPPNQPLFGDPTQFKPQPYDPNNPLMYMVGAGLLDDLKDGMNRNTALTNILGKAGNAILDKTYDYITGGSIPINKKLYEKAKEIVYPKYKKPSAYRSGAVIKLYKELGGKFKEQGERKLKRWFKEEWNDIGNKDYPVYRPSRRITKDTPLTIKEIDPENLQLQIAEKQKIKGNKNLEPFVKKGGKLYAKDKYATGEKELTPTEKTLVKREMGEGNPEIAEIASDPMGDDDIKKYFPNAKILKYSELKNYTNINQLLPRPKTFFFLLYERSPNVGHWVLVSRYKDNGIDTIEFFCSYGSKIDEPLTWTPIGMRVQLGADKPYLSILLDKSGLKTIYNPVQYQSKKSNIATCGAYDTLRAGELIKHNTTLDEFNDMLSEVKKATGLNYDEIVSNLVDLR